MVRNIDRILLDREILLVSSCEEVSKGLESLKLLQWNISTGLRD